MDLKCVMAIQVIKSYRENKIRDEKARQTEVEKDQESKQKRGTDELVEAIRFAILKNKMENSPLRGILETLSQELNSSSPEFAILKARIVEMVRKNPHSEIGDNPNFFVDKPYNYEGGSHKTYSLSFFTGGDQGLQYNKIFSVTYSIETDHFSFDMDLYQYNRHFTLTKTDPESMARNIISYIMSE